MNEFKGRTVLVTGADGFIGSHLVERLVGDGVFVRAFCYYNSFGSLGWLDHAPQEVLDALDIRFGDIRDAAFVAEACEGVSAVAHLAALIAIPYSYSAPSSYLETNVTGTLNVLEAVRRHGVSRLVHTSTSEVYGTPDILPIRETHPLKAQSPYAASKVAADQFALSYQRSFGTPVVILRPFNTYGPRQSTRAVIPTILTQLLGGAKVIELGRTDPRRDLTFVADTVDGFVRALDVPGIEGETFQLGTGFSPSIGEVFLKCCEALGVRAEIRQDPKRLRPDASEVQVLLSDPALAKSRLGWEARTPLVEGLARTAAWVRTNMDLVSRPFYR